jgi:hypothetical protein
MRERSSFVDVLERVGDGVHVEFVQATRARHLNLKAERGHIARARKPRGPKRDPHR